MNYTELLEKQITDRLKIDNPWWITDAIPPYLSEMSPRMYLDIFYPIAINSGIRRAVVLMGPRRVGKTVMLYHTIQRLINDGVPSRNIIYVSVETPIYNGIALEQLFTLAKQIVGKADKTDENFYVFFDEIQYLKDWEVHLKSLVDTYYSTKFVVSGSAAAALKKQSNESGAGRFTDFTLPPLTFYEYVHLKGLQNNLKMQKMEWSCYNIEALPVPISTQQFNKAFIDYINFGGYPEVALRTDMQNDPAQYVKQDIVDKVLLRDLPSLYGIQDVQELNSLFTMLAYHSGKQFSYEGLSHESGVRKETLKKYIQYLEAAFLIKVIHRTDDTARRFQRDTMFKIYLTNPSLRCALFQPITENDHEIGDMIETAVYAQWIPRPNVAVNYANWKIGRNEEGEVDIVGLNVALQKPWWAVEVKWTDRFFDRPNDLKSLAFFIEQNKLPGAVVTTIAQAGIKKMSFGELLFLPTAAYAYIVGRNTINQTKYSFGL